MSDPVRIANFLMTLDNDYQTLQRDVCRVAAKRHGFSVRELSARNDAEAQLRQIKGCLAEPEGVRPRALLVHPVIESCLLPAAEEAARLGVAFVLLNRSCWYIGELRTKFPRVPLFSVDPDQRKIGRIQGQQIARLLPRGGDLLYIQGTVGTSSAQHRLEGVKAALAGLNVHLIIAQGDWSAASGTTAVQHWLRTRITTRSDCVVAAQNDSMAIGARAALVSAALELKRPELMDMPVTGCDGTVAQGQAYVRSRELCATVVIPSSADRAVNELALVFASGKVPMVDITLDVSSFPDIARIEKSTPAKPTGLPSSPRPKRASARG
jgi:ABC-type sugar transport system substrate-binding protein